MLTIYFGTDKLLNQSIRSRLDLFNLEYQEYSSDDINDNLLMTMFKNCEDLFDLLKPGLRRYKLDNKLPLSKFIQKILNDIDNSLNLPLIIENDDIYPGITPDEIGRFIPKECRREERKMLFRKLEKLDEGKSFWLNYDDLRKEAEIRNIEVLKQLFADILNDKTKLKIARDRFYRYRVSHEVPPKEIVSKLSDILLVDQAQFFKTRHSQLQNF